MKNKELLAIAIALVALPVIFFLLTFSFTDPTIDKDFSITWFVTSFTLLSSVVAFFYIAIKSLDDFSKDIKKNNEKIKTTVEETLNKELRNTRIPLNGIDQVRKEVAKIYREARNSAESSNDGMIYYFGGASLYPTSEEIDKIKKKIDEQNEHHALENSSAFDIQDEFDKITSSNSKVIFNRYIKIPNVAELTVRSTSYRKGLLSWLERQVYVISRCDRYTLYVAARAFEYSSLTSFVAGPTGIVEVIGNGEGGAVVRSQAERTSFVDSVISYLNKAAVGNTPKPYNNSNVDELKALIEKLNLQ